MTEYAVAAEGLGLRYRSGWVVRGLDFQVPSGAVTALVGRNGAGKSTLLHALAGLRRPSEGSVRVLGRPPWARGPGGVGFLAQDKPLYGSFTVAETVTAARHLNPGWDQALADRLLEEAELPPRARVGSLSGGHRARLALTVALCRRPDLLLLDEPMAEMDPVARQDMVRALMGAVAETGMGLVVSSHTISELEEVCDHLLLLRAGGLLLQGPVEELADQHRVVIAARHEREPDFAPHEVVALRRGERQVRAFLRVNGEAGAPDWTVTRPGLDELVQGYLRPAGREDVA
ncbi:ABC-2 type transport system ATP-binding protein [Crossiella equi]|uniref:ABC-2 type transport system ATP-binding protein n=1 Tax=Crossiella equi TaxID=130796 RepID=A0ABS5A6U6_9PSEU|nr:ABC transporter ATP-binding protein [Crossiella equi]MBP2472324.1 ABC-2 type transport system ATP-binding protein [Crossiella equi]